MLFFKKCKFYTWIPRRVVPHENLPAPGPEVPGNRTEAGQRSGASTWRGRDRNMAIRLIETYRNWKKLEEPGRTIEGQSLFFCFDPSMITRITKDAAAEEKRRRTGGLLVR